jgi:hypothetical protein
MTQTHSLAFLRRRHTRVLSQPRPLRAVTDQGLRDRSERRATLLSSRARSLTRDPSRVFCCGKENPSWAGLATLLLSGDCRARLSNLKGNWRHPRDGFWSETSTDGILFANKGKAHGPVAQRLEQGAHHRESLIVNALTFTHIELHHRAQVYLNVLGERSGDSQQSDSLLCVYAITISAASAMSLGAGDRCRG